MDVTSITPFLSCVLWRTLNVTLYTRAGDGCHTRELSKYLYYAHPMKGDVKEKNSLPSPRGKPGRGDIQPCLLIRGAFDVAALDRRVIQRRCQPQLIIPT